MESSIYAPELFQIIHEQNPELYPAPTAEEQLFIAKYEIRRKYAAMLSQVVSPYLLTERETWPTQVLEANAYLLNVNADVPLITALALNRGVALAALVTWIKENEAKYRIAVGTLLGMQQAELDALG
jgi:hypothetical protein